MITRRAPIKRTAIKRKTPKVRSGMKDPQYLAWLHDQPCEVNTVPWWRRDVSLSRSICQYGIEAAHVGTRGLSQKCADRFAIPLCRNHHRIGPYSAHATGKAFWELHKIDRDEIIARLHSLYREETGRDV